MQRMDAPVLAHGARGGDERLADHQPAEDALPAHLRATAAEKILFENFDVEYGEKIGNGG